MPHLTHFRDESRQSIALVLTTKTTKPKHTTKTQKSEKTNRKKLPYLPKQTKSLLGMSFTTSGQKMGRSLFV